MFTKCPSDTFNLLSISESRREGEREIKKLRTKWSFKNHEILAHPLEWLLHKQNQKMSVGEDLEKLEPLGTADGNIKWCIHGENQDGSSSKN